MRRRTSGTIAGRGEGAAEEVGEAQDGEVILVVAVRDGGEAEAGQGEERHAAEVRGDRAGGHGAGLVPDAASSQGAGGQPGGTVTCRSRRAGGRLTPAATTSQRIWSRQQSPDLRSGPLWIMSRMARRGRRSWRTHSMAPGSSSSRSR